MESRIRLRGRRDLLGTTSNSDKNSYERSVRKYLNSSRRRQSHYAAAAAFTRYFQEFLAAKLCSSVYKLFDFDQHEAFTRLPLDDRRIFLVVSNEFLRQCWASIISDNI